MGKKEDVALVRDFKERLVKDYSVDTLILFGSRARGDSEKASDFDLIVVSDDFKKEAKRYMRVAPMYDYWKHDYPVDFICLTKEEFNSTKNRITLTKKAVEEGIKL